MATERKIGREVYRCEKVSASDGFKLFLRVVRLFREAPDMMGSLMKGDAEKKGAQAFMVLALGQEGLDEGAHDLLVELAEKCTVKGEPCIVGHHLTEIEDLIQVAWFAMEVNFKDFLAASLADR